MQNFRLAAVIVLLLIVLPSLAFAAPFTVEQLPVLDSIIEGESAAFDVRVTNNQDSTDTFRFSTNDLLWDMLSDPLYHYFSGVEIRPGESQTVRLLLRPVQPLEYGRYKVVVNVKAGKTESAEELPLFTTYRPAKPLLSEYLAAVNQFVEMPSVVDPRDPVVVKVNLVNRNPKNLEDVTLIFSSKTLNKKVVTSLDPLERKVVEETFTMDPMTQPQEDSLTVQLVVDGSVLDPSLKEPFAIGSFPDIVEISTQQEKSFLKTVTTTSYQNKGNVEGSKTIELRTNYFRSSFTKANPEPFEVNKGRDRFLAWELVLKPGESTTIIRTVSYLPLLVLIAMALGAIAIYYLFRSPVQVIKRASVLTLKDSGISEIKVIIHVKNRTEKVFERVTITDIINTASDVYPGADVGTLKPDSVYNDGAKTIVKWELDNLDSSEERIMSYMVRSKFSIIDSITLPPTVTRFYTAKGAKIITRSDSVTVRV